MANDARSYGPGPRGIDEALADLDAGEAEIASRFGLPAPTGGLGYQQPGYGGVPPAGYGQPGYPPNQQAPAQPGQPWAQPPPPPPPVASAPAADPAKPADTPAAGPPAPVEPSAAPQSSDDEAEREEKDRCEIACRALGSMKRAAEHVCRAAGSSDGRCARAKDRVAAASARVAASCEDCDG